jgi:calcineurin-like phosphoesterase family protein
LNGLINVVPSAQDRWATEAKEFDIPLYSKSGKLVKLLPQMHEVGMLSNHLVLNHYPMRVWNKSVYGAFHLYGNTHATMADYGYSTDVGVDAWDFTPVSYEQIVKKFDAKLVTEYKIFRRD